MSMCGFAIIPRVVKSMILTLVTQLAKCPLVHYNQVLVYFQSQFYDTTKSKRFLLSELSLSGVSLLQQHWLTHTTLIMINRDIYGDRTVRRNSVARESVAHPTISQRRAPARTK